MMERDATVVGLPVPGVVGIDVRTSEDDWVVTGSHRGMPFRRYVSPNVDSDAALAHAVAALGLNRHDIEWIMVRRRHEVERCVRADALRSRAR